jgi:hypothetical protein
LTSYPIPDPNPATPPFEAWMFALLFIGALVFIMWWILTMLPPEVRGYYNWKKDAVRRYYKWKKDRKEKRT